MNSLLSFISKLGIAGQTEQQSISAEEFDPSIGFIASKMDHIDLNDETTSCYGAGRMDGQPSGIGQPFVMTPAIQGTEYTYFDQVESPLSGPLVTPTKTPSMLRTYPSPASDQDQGSPVSSSSSSPLLYSQALIPEWNRAPTPQLLFDDIVLFDSPEGRNESLSFSPTDNFVDLLGVSSSDIAPHNDALGMQEKASSSCLQMPAYLHDPQPFYPTPGPTPNPNVTHFSSPQLHGVPPCSPIEEHSASRSRKSHSRQRRARPYAVKESLEGKPIENGRRVVVSLPNGELAVRYECTSCGAQVGRGPDLKRHHRTCLFREEYFCEDITLADGSNWKGCGTLFARRDACYRHIKKRLERGRCTSIRMPLLSDFKTQKQFESRMRQYEDCEANAEMRRALPAKEKNRLANLALKDIKQPMFQESSDSRYFN